MNIILFLLFVDNNCAPSFYDWLMKMEQIPRNQKVKVKLYHAQPFWIFAHLKKLLLNYSSPNYKNKIYTLRLRG